MQPVASSNELKAKTPMYTIIKNDLSQFLTDNNNMFVIESITVGASFICFTISIYVITDYTRAIKGYPWERKLVKWLGGICLMCYLISLSLTTASRVIYILDPSHPLFVILYGIDTIFWVMAECFTYIIFILRIYYTFQNTPLQPKSYIFKILLCAIILFIISQFQFIFLIVMWYMDILSNNAFVIATDAQIVFNDIIDLFISIALFYLFISKLYKISKTIHSNPNNNIINGKKIQNNNHTILFNVTAKLTVLAFLPLIVTQIDFIFEIILAILSRSYEGENTIWLESDMLVYVYLIDAICSIWCIYMTFTIENAQLWYGRCCKKCDTKCKSHAQNKYLRKPTNSSYFELTDTETAKMMKSSPSSSPRIFKTSSII
eukprot:428800_1